MTKKEIASYVLAAACTAAIVYIVLDEDFDLKFLRAVSKACQGTARVIGQVGLDTERAYFALVESGRMV